MLSIVCETDKQLKCYCINLNITNNLSWDSNSQPFIYKEEEKKKMNLIEKKEKKQILSLEIFCKRKLERRKCHIGRCYRHKLSSSCFQAIPDSHLKTLRLRHLQVSNQTRFSTSGRRRWWRCGWTRPTWPPRSSAYAASSACAAPMSTISLPRSLSLFLIPLINSAFQFLILLPNSVSDFTDLHAEAHEQQRRHRVRREREGLLAHRKRRQIAHYCLCSVILLRIHVGLIFFGAEELFIMLWILGTRVILRLDLRSK